MTLEQQVAELEKALQTLTEAHHTALEVERKKAIDYQEKCVALEFEIEALKRKVRELEAQRDKYQDDLQINVDAGRRIIAKLKVDVDLWKHAADQAALILKIAGAPDFQDAVHAHEWGKHVVELEAQLAQAQAALRCGGPINQWGFRLKCDTCGDLFNDHHEGESCPGEFYKNCKGTLQFNTPPGWLSPDESKALQDRLAKYEKQWSKMDYTICKLEQDLRKAKGEQ